MRMHARRHARVWACEDAHEDEHEDAHEDARRTLTRGQTRQLDRCGGGTKAAGAAAAARPHPGPLLAQDSQAQTSTVDQRCSFPRDRRRRKGNAAEPGPQPPECVTAHTGPAPASPHGAVH